MAFKEIRDPRQDEVRVEFTPKTQQWLERELGGLKAVQQLQAAIRDKSALDNLPPETRSRFASIVNKLEYNEKNGKFSIDAPAIAEYRKEQREDAVSRMAAIPIRAPERADLGAPTERVSTTPATINLSPTLTYRVTFRGNQTEGDIRNMLQGSSTELSRSVASISVYDLNTRSYQQVDSAERRLAALRQLTNEEAVAWRPKSPRITIG